MSKSKCRTCRYDNFRTGPHGRQGSMEREIGQRLVARAKELQLSNAEVARRLELAESRYAHYVSGSREPDFATFIRICNLLRTSPNDVLGFPGTPAATSADSVLRDRAGLALSTLSAESLSLAVDFLELLERRQTAGTPVSSTDAARK